MFQKNNDIIDLWDILCDYDFTIYHCDYPCHSLDSMEIVYYDENCNGFDITFDNIIDKWKSMSYEDICNEINNIDQSYK